MAASLKLKSKLCGVLRRISLADTSQNARVISTCSVNLASLKLKETDQNTGEVNTDGRKTKNIFLPQKIERSPTAILEALSSTIKVVPTSPMYMEIDDPATLDMNQDSSITALHNGRKAARLMISMYPDYFSQMWDESINEGFNDDDPCLFKISKPSEEALLERINKKAVKEAGMMYEECKRNSVALSLEIREALLELLCVYNCDDPKLTAGTDAFMHFDRDIFDFKYDVADTWRQGNQAETLFKELPEKTEKAYNVLLRGMANHHHKNAYDIYSEMKSNKIPVDVESFNCLLSKVKCQVDSSDEAMDKIKELLSDMNLMNVIPNTATFDSALVANLFGFTTSAKIKFAIGLVAEMKACNCELQLSTYSALLRLFFTGRQGDNTRGRHTALALNKEQLIEEMLNSMEGREFTVNTPQDVAFFALAASAIHKHLADSKLMLKLHGILSHGNNHNALGAKQLTQNYYHDLLTIIVQLEHTDTVMRIYNQLNYPSFRFFTHSSGTNTALDLLSNIDMHNTHHYLPQIFNDFFNKSILFGERDQVLPALLKLMAKKVFNPELQQQFSSIASIIIDHWSERISLERVNLKWTFRLDSYQMSQIMTIYMNNEEMDKAVNTFQLLDAKGLIRDEDPPRGGSLARMAEYFITMDDFKNTYTAIEYLIEFHKDNKDVNGVIDKASSSLHMTERQSASFKTLTKAYSQ